MPNYDLSTPKAISAAAKDAHERAAHEPSQGSYNAAWLHGYARALSDTDIQLKTYQKAVDNLFDYLQEHLDKNELYSILQDDLEMNQEEISCLGFQFDKHGEQSEIKQEDFLFLSDAFKDKALSHWSFTGLYEEHEKTLRGLLDSGKDFDTGEGYSEDETIFLRISAEGNKIKIILRQELDYEEAQDFVRDLAKGDPYEEVLTDELTCSLAEYFSAKPVFTEGISEHCSLRRQASIEEIMNNIEILETTADNRMKGIWNELRSAMHEELLTAIPDEPEMNPSFDNAVKPSLSDKILNASARAFEGQKLNSYCKQLSPDNFEH